MVVPRFERNVRDELRGFLPNHEKKIRLTGEQVRPHTHLPMR